jgi:hypothetical protein
MPFFDQPQGRRTKQFLWVRSNIQSSMQSSGSVDGCDIYRQRNGDNMMSLLHFLDLDSTTKQTGLIDNRYKQGTANEENQVTYPTSSNKTNFLARNSRASDCRGLSDVLMVTTTMRMVDGVHSHTTSTRPARHHQSVRTNRVTADKTHTCSAWPCICGTPGQL